MELFVVPTISFRRLYGLLIMGHGRLQFLWFGVTAHPTAEWIANVDAPCKAAVWFERSSHMVPWEEPGKTLVSLLRHVRPLATEPDSCPAASH